MRWLSFLSRKPRPLPEAERQRISADIDAALARRRAGRAARSDRSRRGAVTKAHQQFARDALLNEPLAF